MNLIIEAMHGQPVDQWAVEAVERKGLGHPDSICDALAEEFGRRRCRFYIDRFGAIAHHNVDKALLRGGVAQPAFGGGDVVEPMEIYLAGRATCEFKGVVVPVEEIADDGEVGRGNRANGLITPFRPMTMEAVAGKNPVSHVGKLYNLAAGRIAENIVAEISAVTDAQCCLVSQIGRQVTDPDIANVQVRTIEGVDVEEVAPMTEEIVRSQLSQIGSFWREMIDGKVEVY